MNNEKKTFESAEIKQHIATAFGGQIRHFPAFLFLLVLQEKQPPQNPPFFDLI